MRVSWPVELIGTGVCVPNNCVTNAEFAARLDTSDEWIQTRTGIRERRVAEPHESTGSLSLIASRLALEDAGVAPDLIDLIICGTFTPDHPLPSTACELQASLGCRMIPAYDLAAACSGFVWSLITGAQNIVSGMADHVLIIGAEILSRLTDMEDRTTAILFGDGAGAAVLRRSRDPRCEILAVNLGADGGRGQLIWIPAGGSKEPASPRTLNERLHYIRMKGREVYKFAVTQMQELIDQTLADAGVKPEEVALFVPHQSNLRIIESAVEKLGFPRDKVVINIDRYGNTSAASVPLALHEARRAGRIRKGDLVMMVAFGAGLTWGSVLMRM